MSKVSHLPKNVPSKEIPFAYSGKGNLTGHEYSGDFVVKVPDARALSRIGLELAKLGQGVPFEHLDENTQKLHNALAYIRTVVVEAPNWFRNTPEDAKEPGMDFGLAADDLNVPIEIFLEADKKIEGWKNALKGIPKIEE